MNKKTFYIPESAMFESIEVRDVSAEELLLR